MMRHTWIPLIALMLVSSLVAPAAERAPQNVIWVDFDMKNIPEPQTREVAFFEHFFEAHFVEQAKRSLDVPRLMRAAVGNAKPAANTNALDEVPDSSWYTNRHHRRRMTTAELVRGPNTGNGPDFTSAVVTKAKMEGVTRGLQLKDAAGDTYLVKFDQADFPELQSGAEVISTKILYAAGYNVPENYIAYIDPKKLQLADSLEFVDPATRQTRKFTNGDLYRLLEDVARMPDGRYRVMASKMLSGKPKGPFAFIGMRKDDPNDLIPHEHRRELRGLRVIASWINHWDMKEQNTLDMFVEEHGRHFLKHYLIDFGSTLGGGLHPLEYFHGREYAFDLKVIAKEGLTLGLYPSADDKKLPAISPAVGLYSADDFDPEGWKPSFHVIPFDNMTEEDAFWATRIIMSFSDAELRSIVQTAEYTNPADTEHMVRALLERRQLIARYWLNKKTPLVDVALQQRGDDVTLTFRDLMINGKLVHPQLTEYRYRVRAPGYTHKTQSTREPAIVLDRKALGSALEEGSTKPVEVTIWAQRDGKTLDPVRVYIYAGRDNSIMIGRIERG